MVGFYVAYGGHKVVVIRPFRSLVKAKLLSWDNYKGSPMLELWTARTRTLRAPQVPD